MNTNTTSQDTDYDTDIMNAHDDSSYTPEQLEAAYARMKSESFDGQLYGTDTVIELPDGWEDEETYDDRKGVY